MGKMYPCVAGFQLAAVCISAGSCSSTSAGLFLFYKCVLEGRVVARETWVTKIENSTFANSVLYKAMKVK